ncbi:MAG: hypothetical protein J3T61_12280, partial [Candidatus Brocadiales bacterium]|nr:hypothetical protein [Candidatus Bathyanammoxibius sp.]
DELKGGGHGGTNGTGARNAGQGCAWPALPGLGATPAPWQGAEALGDCRVCLTTPPRLGAGHAVAEGEDDEGEEADAKIDRHTKIIQAKLDAALFSKNPQEFGLRNNFKIGTG